MCKTSQSSSSIHCRESPLFKSLRQLYRFPIKGKIPGLWKRTPQQHVWCWLCGGFPSSFGTLVPWHSMVCDGGVGHWGAMGWAGGSIPHGLAVCIWEGERQAGAGAEGEPSIHLVAQLSPELPGDVTSRLCCMALGDKVFPPPLLIVINCVNAQERVCEINYTVSAW